MSPPCQVYDQPPYIAGTWFAVGPVTNTRAVFASGSRPPSFLSSVIASAAASRLTALERGRADVRDHRRLGKRVLEQPEVAPSCARMRRHGLVDARHSGTAPSFTSAMRSSVNDQLSGTMLMSIPAITAWRTASLLFVATRCTRYSRMMSSQSLVGDAGEPTPSGGDQ